MNEENKNAFGADEPIADQQQIFERFPIEDDSDTLEPFVDETEFGEINADDPLDVAAWAAQFQISIEELKAAIVLNGNSVKAIKKYLSV